MALPHLDTHKSIIKGRLVYKHSWENIIDKIFTLFLFMMLILLPTLLYFQLDLKKPNDQSFAFVIFPLIILFVLYFLIRKLKEDDLIKIETSFSYNENKKFLLLFLKQKGYTISDQFKDVIMITDEEEISISKLWTNKITFIISDNYVYFNIMKDYPRFNPPVLLTHIFLKKDLKKFFTEQNN